jgi:hypothetical protein
MGLRSFYKVIGNCLGHHGTSLLQASRGLGFGIYRKQNDHVEIGTVASLGVVCCLLGSDVLAEKQQTETGERGTSICIDSVVDEHDCIDNNRWWRFVQYTF